MPPMRIPTARLAQAVRTFSTGSGALRHGHQLHLHDHVLNHAPSQRILSKAATRASAASASSIPMFVRDATSYAALGALTSEAAFLIYCWDPNADMESFFAVT